jgi:hypothetical protein
MALVRTDKNGWEATFRPLTALDICGLSEKAISKEELHEQYRTTKLMEALASIQKSVQPPTAGDTIMDVDDAAVDRDSNNPLGTPCIHLVSEFTDIVGPGKGKQMVSWIWHAGLQYEDVNDPQLSNGNFCAV